MAKKNTGLNKSRVEEILDRELVNEAVEPKAVEQTEQEVNEREELQNMIGEQPVMTEVFNEVELEILEGELKKKEQVKMDKMRLEFGIKNAIIAGKGLATRGIDGKQLKAIIDNYEIALNGYPITSFNKDLELKIKRGIVTKETPKSGIQMTEKQLDCMKKLNTQQAIFVISTINKFNSLKKQEAREQKDLATNE